MSEKSQREAYIRASDQRVAKWSKSKREAFQSAVDRIIEPQQRSTSSSSRRSIGFTDSLNELTKRLEKLEASILITKKEIAKMLAEVKE